MKRTQESLTEQEKQIYQRVFYSYEPEKTFLEVYGQQEIRSPHAEIAFWFLPLYLMRNVTYGLQKFNMKNDVQNQTVQQDVKKIQTLQRCKTFCSQSSGLISEHQTNRQQEINMFSCFMGCGTIGFICVLFLWFVVNVNLNNWLLQDYSQIMDPISKQLELNYFHQLRDIAYVGVKLIMGFTILIPIGFAICCTFVCCKGFWQSLRQERVKKEQFQRIIRELRERKIRTKQQ